MLLVALPAAAGLAIVAAPLARALLPPAYGEAAHLIIPLGAAAGLCAGLKYFVFDQAFHMAKAGWQSALTLAPPALLGAALIAWGATALGPVGVAAAVCAQFGLGLGISILFTHRLLPFAWPWAEIGKIAGMTAAMAMAAQATLAGLANASAPSQLAAAMAAGAAAYALAGLLLRPGPVREALAHARLARA